MVVAVAVIFSMRIAVGWLFLDWTDRPNEHQQDIDTRSTFGTMFFSLRINPHLIFKFTARPTFTIRSPVAVPAPDCAVLPPTYFSCSSYSNFYLRWQFPKSLINRDHSRFLSVPNGSVLISAASSVISLSSVPLLTCVSIPSCSFLVTEYRTTKGGTYQLSFKYDYGGTIGYTNVWHHVYNLAILV